MSIMNAVAPIKARADNSASLSRQQNPTEPSLPSASDSGLGFSENHTHFESFLPQPPKDLPVLPETPLEIPNQDALVGSEFQTLLSSTTPISPPVPISRVTPFPTQESQGNEPKKLPDSASTENTLRPRQNAQHSSGKTHTLILPSHQIETTTENHRVIRTDGPSHAQQTPSGTSVPQAPSIPIRYPADASTQHGADPLPKKDSASQSPTPTANPAGQDGNIRQELLSRTYPFNNERKQEQQQQSPETQQNRPNRQIREQEKGPGIPPAQHPSNGLTTSTDKGAQTNMDRHPKPLNQPRIQSSPRQAASGSAPLQGQPTETSNRFFLDRRALDPSTVSASASQPSGLDPSVDLSPSRTAPGSMSRLGQIEQIQSIVKEHAIILRRFNQDSLTAEIRPDGKTSITLSLQANSDGITVTAQMDAKNADWLKGNWPALQSRLADHNIFLEDPKDRQSTPGQHSDPGDSRQASHRPHNSRGATNDKQEQSEQQTNTKTNPTESTELSSERVYWA